MRLCLAVLALLAACGDDRLPGFATGDDPSPPLDAGLGLDAGTPADASVDAGDASDAG